MKRTRVRGVADENCASLHPGLERVRITQLPDTHVLVRVGNAASRNGRWRR
jgi:hypothetical protein